jgi:alcohol dehydrogenase class IV
MPDIKAEAVFFHGFTANPDINQAYEGIRQYTANNCDYLISLGGGSAIDVAKSINILSENKQISLLERPRAKHLSIPSTAGTGSEATRFAVMYNNGGKLSIEHEGLLPDYVILDPDLLVNLPDYHKKSTLLDAMCQAIEAIWAKGKTAKSRAYALSAMRIILEDVDNYFADNQESALRILQAANLAGKAINISKTTAAHAMSYKLSSVLNIAHGHAVALCLPLVWAHLLENNKAPEGLFVEQYNGFLELFAKLGLAGRFAVNGNKTETTKSLAQAVNPQRLRNHPIEISEELLVRFYSGIID